MRILGVIGTFGVCGAAVAAAGCATTAVMEQELTKTNTQTVLAFEETVFNKHDVSEAFLHYVGPIFLQHDVQQSAQHEAQHDAHHDVQSDVQRDPAAGGRGTAQEAYTDLVTKVFPHSQLLVERTVAQHDLVATQGLWREKAGQGPSIPVVDIYRLRDGRIIEHWDVVQGGVPVVTGIEGLL